jgi:DNA-binding FrmR family transcriptional regulator
MRKKTSTSTPAATTAATAPGAAAVKSTSQAQDYRQEHQKDMVNRLRRIEGQVRGLVDMIEGGRSCEEVATQMSATRKAMEKAFYRMMTCSLIEAVHESKTDEQAIAEVSR